ncbi:MAG: hypothetical protein AB9834_16900 [Lentimicrobium sp.]
MKINIVKITVGASLYFWCVPAKLLKKLACVLPFDLSAWQTACLPASSSQGRRVSAKKNRLGYASAHQKPSLSGRQAASRNGKQVG